MQYTKRNPEELQLFGVSFMLTVLNFSIQPFASIVANYTCCDGDKESYYVLHAIHLPSVVSVGETAFILFYK